MFIKNMNIIYNEYLLICVYKNKNIILYICIYEKYE